MPNALANEKSPYLLQHAGNPVNWLPWGEEAFARARREDKPIFLSIGYSTCHWCHVMAHESFESPETAAILNEHFVAVKVDREERPDVDRVYMTYVQIATGHGGWPLSAWLTPDLRPFYGGTYFPPSDVKGRHGFPSVLRAIANGWRTDRPHLLAQAGRVIEVLRAHQLEANAAPDGADIAEAAGDAFARCFGYFQQSFDAEHGGFGGAPKFPRAANINFLLCAGSGRHDQPDIAGAAVQMAAHTLQMMMQGGIHDHVGGGFHRYSVDGEWFVPHFEKMLYDQAQIAMNAIDLRRATGDERFAWIARDILEYVKRDLADPGGGFYSAEDADSELASEAISSAVGPAKAEAPAAAAHPEKVEGAFYVWTKREIDEVLGSSAELFCAHFDVVEGGNVPTHADPRGDFAGRNILAQRQPLAATAQAFKLEPGQANDLLVACLAKLREVRARRPRPHLDDKIITAWNGLMISALAKAASLAEAGFGDPGYLQSAVRAAEFVERELYDRDSGRLFRSFREGRGSAPGFAEDYACFIQGLLDLYEASFDLRWFRWALKLQETMDATFWDDSGGGYFSSPAGDPSILMRLKDDYDGAEPAANSVAAMNLLRMAAVLDGTPYREKAARTVAALRGRWSGTPHALPQMLCALELLLGAPRHVVLAGNRASRDFIELAAELRRDFGPRRAVIALVSGEDHAWWAQRAPWLAGLKPQSGRATAYVCEEFTCKAPASTPAELRAALTP